MSKTGFEPALTALKGKLKTGPFTKPSYLPLDEISTADSFFFDLPAGIICLEVVTK